jgi:MoxR-like ATPase
MTVHQLRPAIAAQLIGRDEVADVLALAMVARDHVLMVGPPGTAKSHVCRVAGQAVAESRFFERLLSGTTPPEQLFGPISLAALRQDRYEHVTAGYAADAHFLYLDEIGRAGPAISDTLLHLLGPERQALIGQQQVRTPLVTAVGTANTWPEDAAMLDRWTIRITVNYLPPRERRALMSFAPPPMEPVTTLGELEAAHTASRALTWSKAAIAAFDNILADMDDAGIIVSDRRLRSADRIARASAILNGQTEHVTPGDLAALRYVLWTLPEQAPKCSEIVMRHAAPLSGRLDAVCVELYDLDASAARNSHELPTIAAKVATLRTEVTDMAQMPEASDPAAVRVVQWTQRLLAAVERRTHARTLGIVESKLPVLPSKASAAA